MFRSSSVWFKNILIVTFVLVATAALNILIFWNDRHDIVVKYSTPAMLDRLIKKNPDDVIALKRKLDMLRKKGAWNNVFELQSRLFDVERRKDNSSKNLSLEMISYAKREAVCYARAGDVLTLAREALNLAPENLKQFVIGDVLELYDIYFTSDDPDVLLFRKYIASRPEFKATRERAWAAGFDTTFTSVISRIGLTYDECKKKYPGARFVTEFNVGGCQEGADQKQCQAKNIKRYESYMR